MAKRDPAADAILHALDHQIPGPMNVEQVSEVLADAARPVIEAEWIEDISEALVYALTLDDPLTYIVRYVKHMQGAAKEAGP